MNIEASLELKNYVALKRDNYTYSVDSENSVASSTRNLQSVYRWVIHPRWETPILDFSNSTVSALNLDGKTVTQVQNSPWKKRYQDKYYDGGTIRQITRPGCGLRVNCEAKKYCLSGDPTCG